GQGLVLGTTAAAVVSRNSVDGGVDPELAGVRGPSRRRQWAYSAVGSAGPGPTARLHGGAAGAVGGGTIRPSGAVAARDPSPGRRAARRGPQWRQPRHAVAHAAASAAGGDHRSVVEPRVLGPGL